MLRESAIAIVVSGFIFAGVLLIVRWLGPHDVLLMAVGIVGIVVCGIGLAWGIAAATEKGRSSR